MKSIENTVIFGIEVSLLASVLFLGYTVAHYVSMAWRKLNTYAIFYYN